MMRFFVGVSGVLLSCALSDCRGEGVALSGAVFDESTQQPVVGAAVTCAEPGYIPTRIVHTGANGRFVIEGCPHGLLDIEVRAKDYVATTISMNGEARDFDVRLKRGSGWRAGGVGARLRQENENFLIDVVPGGALERAGIDSGSVLVAIDGEPVAGSIDIIANRLRGSPGTRLTVTVQKPHKAETREVEVTRSEIVDP